MEENDIHYGPHCGRKLYALSVESTEENARTIQAAEGNAK
jgi:hypothetical protein